MMPVGCLRAFSQKAAKTTPAAIPRPTRIHLPSRLLRNFSDPFDRDDRHLLRAHSRPLFVEARRQSVLRESNFFRYTHGERLGGAREWTPAP